MPTVAIAGGSGFIGVHVATELLDAGLRVVVIDRGRRSPALPLAGVERRLADLTQPIDPSLLHGCDALVNLVGIKRKSGANTFDAVHVDLVRRLRAAAEQAGVARLIHISVAGARPAPDFPYLDSKHRGEQLLLEPSPVATCVLRLGVVHGRGDDFVRNLADSIRAAPFFVAPRSRGLLQLVSVADVALAVRRVLERESVGRSYDIVGPEALHPSEALTRVACVLGRRCRMIAVPARWLAAAAAVIERTSADPLVTRSQLRLLSEGVAGDLEPARRELALEPRPFDAQAIAAALVGVRPRLPSVRLVPDRATEAEIEQLAGRARGGRLSAFALIAVAVLLLGPAIAPGSVWLRMAGLEGALAILALALFPLDWKRAWRPTPLATGIGLAIALILIGGAIGVAAALARWVPDLWAQAEHLYGWAREWPFPIALALLIAVVAAEEVVWRGALGIGLAAACLAHRRSPASAVLASAAVFTVAHVTTAGALLWLAAAIAGAAWAWIAIRCRSLWASFICHLAWDVALLWVIPLA